MRDEQTMARNRVVLGIALLVCTPVLIALSVGLSWVLASFLPAMIGSGAAFLSLFVGSISLGLGARELRRLRTTGKPAALPAARIVE